MAIVLFCSILWAPQDTERRVAATVEGREVFVDQVAREVASTVRERPVDEQARRFLEAQALELLIDRQLILRHLERQKQSASNEDLDLAVGRLRHRITQQGLDWDDHLKSQGLTETLLRESLVWQLAWQRYLERYLTDENLASYFERHRRRFDGTRLRVSQILLKVGSEADPGEAVRRAAAIREEIVSGKSDFAAAARAHSESPSARDGGQLGWISRHEPMPESFSAAAFALEVGEISQPVASQFGVHVILCHEVEAGSQTWKEVESPLRQAMAEYLFQWLAGRERPDAGIRYTGQSPHFKPGTRELAPDT